ncbi:Uncharacterized membrane protein YccC [Faunimonas pinastri]|uniref:Uncharacterized membrane protein YccC n=1 Tax=Faunimonas pinastri TaxID=1855383 RepID=A0A1H9QJR6_9HYPH|nr:FUSC family protein [Faunimonas pinastri]SER60680.1 Uncharacterized membrane protein YccC [Faunimonas pinastri]
MLSQFKRAMASFPNRLLASDPGFIRLQFASRIVGSLILAVGVLFLTHGLLKLPLPAMSIGVMLCLFTSVLVRDQKLGAQRLTVLIAPLPGLVTFNLAAALHGHTILTDATFLLIIFVAVSLRRFGPRWSGLGTISYVGFFIGSYLHPPLSMVPQELVAAAIGTASAYASRFWIFPERPVRKARSILHAVRRRMADLLEGTRDVLRAGAPGERGERLLRDRLANLNGTVAMAESFLDAIIADEKTMRELRAALFRLQVSVERVVELVVSGRGKQEPDADRALAGIARHLRAAQPYPEKMSEEEPDLGRSAARQAAKAGVDPDAARLDLALRELRIARSTFAEASHFLWAEDIRNTDRQFGIGAVQQPIPGPASNAAALRLAAQVTIACGLAIVGGELLSPQRWYWAVITAYFVFAGTNSRADTFVKTFQRLVGTVLGIAAGIAVASLLSGHVLLETILVFPCLFAAYYVFATSYGALVFWITIAFSLLYGALGYFSSGVLLLRLAETLIGCISGGLVAAFIFPVRTRRLVWDALGTYLGSFEEVVKQATLTLRGEDGKPIGAIRKHGANARDLRNLMRPLTQSWGIMGPRSSGRVLAVLLSCDYWLRELAMLSHSEGKLVDATMLEQVEQASGTLCASVASLREDLAARQQPPNFSVRSKIDEAADRVQAEGEGGEAGKSSLGLLRIYRMLDRGLGQARTQLGKA